MENYENYRNLSVYYRLVSLYRDTMDRLEGYGIASFPRIVKINSELDVDDNGDDILVITFEFEFHGKVIVTETKIPYNCNVEMIDTYRRYHLTVDNNRYNPDYDVSYNIREMIKEDAPPHIKEGDHEITYLILPSINEFYSYEYDELRDRGDGNDDEDTYIEYDGYMKIGTDNYELDAGEVFNLEGDIFMIPLYYLREEA